MRIFALALIPALASAFAPPSLHAAPRRLSSSLLRMVDDDMDFTSTVNDMANDIVDQAEQVLETVDNNIVDRGVRLLNHVPVLYTLREFGRAVSSARFGIDAAPEVFAGTVTSPALLNLPSYALYVWPLIAISQLAEVAVSGLAGDESELSQTDITSLSVANVAAMKAITSARPLPWLAAAGVLSAIPLRKSGDNDATLKTAPFQLMSSFATVTSLLTLTSRASGVIPDFRFKGEVISSAALFLYYGLVNREGNGLTRRAVNFGAIAAITASRLIAIGGLSRDLLSASLLGAGLITWRAGKKLMDKLN